MRKLISLEIANAIQRDVLEEALEQYIADGDSDATWYGEAAELLERLKAQQPQTITMLS